MFIFSNLATSIDGKIGVASREQFPLGTRADLDEMARLRRESDAILFGASTLRAYKKIWRVKDADVQPYQVVLSTGLEGISPEWPFFKTPDVKRVLFVTKALESGWLKEFQKTSQVIQLKPPPTGHTNALQIVEHLSALGVERLLIEGGGVVMWDFVQESLIDEYHVTLVPRVMGGVTAPTMVDGKGFTPDETLNLQLKECRAVGNEVFLTYVKTGSRGRDLPE